MGVSYANEHGLLAEDEIGPLQRSHFPQLEAETREGLGELARWLRDRRARARDIIHDRRRARRGKGAAAGTDGAASERGLAAKKQVYARALKRVNARIEALIAERKRGERLAKLHAALDRVQSTPAPHPSGGATRARGMATIPSRKARSVIHPGRVGSVSQQGRNAQARRDAQG